MKNILALDVGTTTVRCHVLNENASTVASSARKVELLYPKPGFVEIDPDRLWEAIVGVINDVLKDETLRNSIGCLGISTQRSSFTSWNPETGKHYHNFITWKDLRANSLVKEWNSSMTMKGLRTGAHILYTITRNKRLLAGSVIKFTNTQMTLRLMWALQHIPGLKEAGANGTAVFGGVDCWLLYKLTGKHISDVSSASATGLFDPFTMQWATWALNILKIPKNIFPRVVDTAGDFGNVRKEIFGVEIPIMCSMADQAAAAFGSGCFEPGNLKVTMGTGSFVSVNTGKQPHASVTGLYPVVGWKMGSELVYIVEGASNDTGILIEWAKELGWINDPSESSDIANSVEDSNGVYFVPAFSGLQAPINDQTAAAGFLGLKPTTRKAHIVRSLLESIAFRILLIFELLENETQYSYNKIRVDGGVSQNNFIMQLLADLTGLEVERATSSEMSIFGVAYIAGLQCGLWQNKDKLRELRKVDKVFKPNLGRQAEYQPIVKEWKQVIQRFKDWYQ